MSPFKKKQGSPMSPFKKRYIEDTSKDFARLMAARGGIDPIIRNVYSMGKLPSLAGNSLQGFLNPPKEEAEADEWSSPEKTERP